MIIGIFASPTYSPLGIFASATINTVIKGSRDLIRLDLIYGLLNWRAHYLEGSNGINEEDSSLQGLPDLRRESGRGNAKNTSTNVWKQKQGERCHLFSLWLEKRHKKDVDSTGKSWRGRTIESNHHYIR